MTTTHEYDTNKRLTRVYNSESEKSFTYGDYDRVTHVSTKINNRTLTSIKEYDYYGRVTKETYPSGYYITNNYDNYGNLISVTDGSSRQIWELVNCDAEGRVLSEKKGGVTTTFRYTAKGQLDSIGASRIMDARYSYYPSGNLKSYKDALSNQTENYTYDALDRLTGWKKPGGYPYDNIDYDANNRITRKYDYFSSSGSSYYMYPPLSGANQLSEETNTDLHEQIITYTDFKKVKTIKQGNGGSDYSFKYGPDGELLRMTNHSRINNNIDRYYAENYEEDNSAYHSQYHYIYGGNGLAAIHTNRGFYNAYTDILGSLAVLAQGSTTIERYAYDPWGNRRNPQNWEQKETGYNLISYRGYTLHEHLDEVGLINMTARLYDPHTSQFLSPDPQLQAPENWLNYNRYSYCMNNPLKYIDPDGEFFHIIIGAIFGGFFNWATNGCRFDIKGLEYFGAGAVVGAINGAVGGWASGASKALGILPGAMIGAGTGAVSGAASGIITNGLNNVIQKEGFFDDWGKTLLNGAISGAIAGAASGGYEGYKNAKANGANRLTGYKKIEDIEYKTEVKFSTPQPNPEQYCYAHSLEYSEKGYSNISAETILSKNDYLPGMDIEVAAKQADIKDVHGKLASKLTKDDWQQLGNKLERGVTEIMGAIPEGGGHAVNITQIHMAKQLKIFGGGTKIVFKGTQVWNPIGGVVQSQKRFLKLTWINHPQ